MNRDLFSKNLSQIETILKEQRLYNLAELREILGNLKHKRLISSSYTFSSFYEQLLKLGLREYSLTIGAHHSTKYSFEQDIEAYELAYLFKKNIFFSMSTALNIQGYSKYRDDFIFISHELSEKVPYNENLTQANIDNAFKKPYRRTHSIGKFKDKNIVFLTPKHTNNYAVIKQHWKISSIDRALVEMIINVQYFRSSTEVIQTFIPLKKHISLNNVFNIVHEFDLIYPYFQCVGYYLEKIGFKKVDLIKFKEKVSKLKFYTDKNQEKYKFDSYWNMFYI